MIPLQTELGLIIFVAFILITNVWTLDIGHCQLPQKFQGDWHFKGPNVALGKFASQLPGDFEQRFARAAVDGNCDTHLSSNSCSHTTDNIGSNPSWTVYLLNTYHVTGIVIYNRNELQERLKHFKIYDNQSGKEEIYDDDQSSNLKYTQDVIVIELDGRKTFSSITVEIPASPLYEKASYLTLCEVEIYAAPRPLCPTPNVEHGEVKLNNSGKLVFNNYTVGSQLQIVCSRNYFLEDDSLLTCNENGQYSGILKKCIPGCKLPTSIVHGILLNNKPWIALNDLLQYTCLDGFRSTTVKCCEEGKYCPTTRYCLEVFCSIPVIPSNGHYLNVSEMSPYNTVIVGKCDVGFTSYEANTRKCRSNGKWSGHALECHRMICSKPKDFRNGNYTYDNGSRYDGQPELYNTRLIGKCNTGYNISIFSEIVCGERNTWKGTKPLCKLVTCSSPENFSYGFYQSLQTLGTYDYGTQINAVCNDGYRLKTLSMSRTCDALGTWSGITPICDLIECPWPLDLHGGSYKSKDKSNGNSLPYNTTITATCDEGFILNNDYTHRRCNEDGTWSNPSTICKEDGHASSLGMILGVSTAAVIVLIAVTTAAIIIYRIRRAKNEHAKRYTDTESTENANEGEYAEIQARRFEESDFNMKSSTKNGLYENARSDTSFNSQDNESSHEQGSSSNTYYNFQNKNAIPKTAIPMKHLSDIALKGESTKKRFENEFKKLPEGMVGVHADALKTENIGKNRYKNLFAYDHSRVVLKKEHEEQSDYINACYVHGYSKTSEFIASQGPTKEILNDFWRMIWQTDCGKIVMLTNLIEERKSKCTQYWPNEGDDVYGDISVTLQKSESFSEFVIRTFTVAKRNCEPKHVTQFHFTAWPDKGVPKYASSLVQFRNKVKYAPTRRDGPIVVHCSAGVGRTGTFIALDFLTDQAKDMGYVDVFGSVKGMRRQRVNLVQTLDQYIFLHHALVETLMLSTSATPSNKFPEWFKSMLQVDHRKKKRKLDIEFETLSKMSPSAEECQYFTAKQISNRQKNRYSNVLPVDVFMPKLEPIENTQGDSTYINAVFLPSYKEKNAFILTQTPLEETKDDFWRLVWEHDIHVIVMMNNINEASRAEQYWPNDSESIMSHNVTIKHTKTEDIKNHKVLTFSLQKYMVSRSVVQVQCGGWQANRNLPDSKDDVLSLLDIVQAIQRKRGNQSVLVHCMNGADKSGLFCVISAVIERMKIEQDVAITHVVEEMRNAREQIIPTLEQYEFCHEVVLAYIEDFSTYSNFSL